MSWLCDKSTRLISIRCTICIVTLGTESRYSKSQAILGQTPKKPRQQIASFSMVRFLFTNKDGYYKNVTDFYWLTIKKYISYSFQENSRIIYLTTFPEYFWYSVWSIRCLGEWQLLNRKSGYLTIVVNYVYHYLYRYPNCLPLPFNAKLMVFNLSY